MKKRIGILLIILVITVLMTGCGKKENNETTVKDEGKSNATVNNAQNNTQEDELFDAYFRIPLHEIYIDVPSSYKHYNNAMTEIFRDQNTKYLSITNDVGLAFDSDEEAYSKIFKKFCVHTEKLNTVLDTDFKTDENLTINGIKTRHYVGSISCKADKEPIKKFITGYSFIMDGVPINIAGVAMGDANNEALNKEITELVDTMMKSVRTTP